MRDFRRLFVRTILFGMALSPALAARAADMSPNDKLDFLGGHWKLAETILETPFGHAGSVVYDAKCDWLPNRTYMVCDFKSEGPDPEHGAIVNNLSLFYFSTADNAYKHTGMGTEGGPHEQTIQIDGNTWTTAFEIPRRSGGAADVRFVYSFLSPEKYLTRFEISVDKGAHWTEVHRSIATKVG